MILDYINVNELPKYHYCINSVYLILDSHCLKKGKYGFDCHVTLNAIIFLPIPPDAPNPIIIQPGSRKKNTLN